MKRYILSGAPGAGKTTLLRQFETEGFGVVEEAATDLIARKQAEGVDAPWLERSFIADVIVLQRERLLRAVQAPEALQFHDRSAICTLALARFLDVDPPPVLQEEIRRLQDEAVFAPKVLMADLLGFIAPTGARRISYDEALVFERLHVEAYRESGFEIVRIAAAPVSERVEAVRRIVEAA